MMTNQSYPAILAIRKAICELARRCDGAQAEDTVGFNGRDSTFGKSIAQQHTWSDRQCLAASKVCRTYVKQLQRYGVDLPDHAAVEAECNSIPEIAGRRRVQFIDGVVVPMVEDASTPRTSGFGYTVLPTSTPRPTLPQIGINRAGNVTVRFPFNRDRVEAMKKLGGTFKDNEWTVPAAYAPLVAGLFPNAQCAPGVDEVVKFWTNAVESRRKLLTEVADTAERTLPSMRVKLNSKASALYAHQIDSILRALRHTDEDKYMRGAVIADEMGLGKTLSSAIAASLTAQAFGCEVVIVAPIITHEGWRTTLAALDMDVSVHSWAKVPEPPKGMYVLVADEAHRAQGGSRTERGKLFLDLAMNQRCVAVFQATGTPMRNGRPRNLFPLLKAINHPLTRNKTGYEVRYCAAGPTAFSQWDASGASNLSELNQRTKSAIIRHLKDDCLDLPRVTRVFRSAEMSGEMKKLVADSLQKSRTEYAKRIAEKMERIDLANSLAAAAGNPHIHYDPTAADAVVALSHVRKAMSMAKVDTAIDYAEDVLDEGRSVVIFFAFKDAAELCAANLRKAGHRVELLTGDTPQKERAAMEHRFQNGQSKVWVSMLQAGGEGITLTAASDLIMVDRDFAPEMTSQAEGRVHRISQTRPVTYCWINLNEIDELLNQVNLEKSEIAKQVIDGATDGAKSITTVQMGKVMAAITAILTGKSKL